MTVPPGFYRGAPTRIEDGVRYARVEDAERMVKAAFAVSRAQQRIVKYQAWRDALTYAGYCEDSIELAIHRNSHLIFEEEEQA